MAKQFPSFEDNTREFAEAQHIYFVATAAADGRVNLSPKGGDSLRILGPNRLIWRNLTGSGNETAGHLRENTRMTVMWCGFEKRPLILRAYGTARAVHVGDADWAQLNSHFDAHVGSRQIYDLNVDLVQTSCGYAVPYFDHQGHRETLDTWSDGKGEAGIHDYWNEKNRVTIDGKPTGIEDYI
jgi:hypothetical protein